MTCARRTHCEFCASAAMQRRIQRRSGWQAIVCPRAQGAPPPAERRLPARNRKAAKGNTAHRAARSDQTGGRSAQSTERPAVRKTSWHGGRERTGAIQCFLGNVYSYYFIHMRRQVPCERTETAANVQCAGIPAIGQKRDQAFIFEILVAPMAFELEPKGSCLFAYSKSKALSDPCSQRSFSKVASVCALRIQKEISRRDMKNFRGSCLKVICTGFRLS